ncbi:MAG: SUF system NifU family Fe-S cluster assembly protein [Elusimicrobia bacterium]|nr:SUF system NifU family Fe-S cluster assembly protein [Elusimicrobiota bacterium]
MGAFEEDLYRDVILDHFKNPRNKGVVNSPDIELTGANPFCGDEIQITAKLAGEKIQDLRINPNGCAISQASASMMAEALEGQSINEIKSRIQLFRNKMLSNGTDSWPEAMEDMESLEGVKKYPVRVKCAVLAWNTLSEGLAEYAIKGAGNKVALRHVEGE